MVKVKICANKSIAEAQMCIDAKADIIGILVGQEHTSNDFVDKYIAKQIVDFVNKRCEVSLVTHLTEASDIIELTEFIGNDIIQLHSDIDEKEVEKIKEALPNIKLVRLIHISSDGEIITDYKNMKYVAQDFIKEFKKKKKGIIFVGKNGTGKTHISIAIANELRKQNIPIIFGTLTDLVEKYSENYKNHTEVELTRLYGKVDLLIIDDLGVEYMNDWLLSKLFVIVNPSYAAL